MRVALLLSALCLTGCEYLVSAEPKNNVPLPPPSQESWTLDNSEAVTSVPPQVEVQSVPAPMASATPPMMRDKNVKSDALRVEVDQLKREIEVLKPFGQKVEAIDLKLSQISDELDRMDGKTLSTQAEMKPKSEPKTKAKLKPKTVNKKASTPQKSLQIASGQKEVGRVRFGKVNGTTRVVLDLGAPSQFSTDLDNEENILIVELPGMKYNAKGQGKGLGLVESYTGKTAEDGTAQIILQLSQNAQIAQSQALPPSGPYGYRVYFDLK